MVLRRPNMTSSESNEFVQQQQQQQQHRPIDEDCNSVSSLSSRTSSLYVEPVKWNDTDYHHQNLFSSTNKNANTSQQISVNKLPKGRGAILAKQSQQLKNKNKDISSSTTGNPKGVSVNRIENPVRKPFGRGTLLKTVENFNNRVTAP